MDRATALAAVALARYADACPSTLHSDCAFAEELPAGRSCERQCRLELQRIIRPGSASTVSAALAFDARQLALSETSLVPEADWHTSSLVQRMRSALLHPPRSADGHRYIVRDIDATSAIAYLFQRGIDAERLVRYGLGRSLPVMLTLWIITERSEPGSSHAPRGWLDYFNANVSIGATEPPGQQLAAAEAHGFLAVVERWLISAPLEHIVSWHFDGIETLAASVDAEERNHATWILDRLGLTYLSDWAPSSLSLEYRYLRGSLEPRVPGREMRLREIPAADVAREIAERHVSGTGQRMSEVTTQAVRLLRDGRRGEAVALFDAARILAPEDADALNNYGFCLTVDDPAAALSALRRAADLEAVPTPLNRINQAVALSLLGDLPGALDLAERAFGMSDSMLPRVWLWNEPDSRETSAICDCDPMEYLCDFAMRLATEVEDGELVSRWKQRIEGRADGATVRGSSEGLS